MQHCKVALRSQMVWALFMTLGAWTVCTPIAFAAEAAGQPASSVNTSAEASPVIFVENPEFDFGDQWLGAPLDFSFTIHNKGKSTLKITGIHHGCGNCTTAGDYPKEIEPGQSGKFPFVLKTETLRGNATKTVIIASNDPATPSLELRVKGNFRKRIELSQSVAFFGPVIGNESASRTIKIKNNTDKALQLKMDPVQSEQFSFELKETDPGQAFELRITTVLPHKPGEMSATAVLNSNIPEEKVVEVKAIGRIPDRLDLYPVTATYVRPGPRAQGRDHVTVTFWLHNYGASLVEVRDAVVDDPALKAIVDTRTPGKNYKIEIKIPTAVGIPPEGRVLTIRTNDPEKPVLTAKVVPQEPAQTTAAAHPPGTHDEKPHVYPAETMLGRTLPEFSLKTLSGSELTHDLAGKITVLNFVSPTCPWCRKQLPEVEKVRLAFESKGVRFVNIVNPNPGGQHQYTDDELIQALGGTKMEVAADVESRLGQLLNATSYPTLFVIGKDGKIASVDLGFNKVGLLQSQLEAALEGKPIPTGTQPAI